MELTRKETKIFLKLVSELQGPAVFQRKLTLNQQDIENCKKKLGVESQEDARRLYKKMEAEDEDVRNKDLAVNIAKQRNAELVANQRLVAMEREKELQQNKTREEILGTIDAVAIKNEDRDRQKQFEALQASQDNTTSDWRLPLKGTKVQQDELVEAFRFEIRRHGYTFCRNKYGVENKEIKAEAMRLGLKIDWSTVRR